MNDKKRNFLKYIFFISFALIFLHTQTVYGEEIQPEDNVGENGNYVSVDEVFTASDGNEYTVTMTGLTEDNKDWMMKYLSENYDPQNPESIKIINEEFCDAEKWSADFSIEFWNKYDAGQCWAAATSNMMWMSGWAEKMVNPKTNLPFSSEDEVFEYMSSKFSDQGGDIAVGIDWFFMGEVFPPGDSSHAGAVHPVYEEDGLFKEIDSELIHETFNLVEDPGHIEELLRLSQQSENPVVAGASIGDLFDGTLTKSGHAVTVAGLISNPAAESMIDRYKAIILIDSDNDGHVSPEEAAGDPPFTADDMFNPEKIAQRRAYRAQVKKNRINSYTVYPLSYQIDAKGTPFWEIQNYSQDGETIAIYRIAVLELPSDELIAEATEKEGSPDIFSNVDLTMEYVFTTDRTEAVPNPYAKSAEDAKKEIFESGNPVNLMYYLGNRSRVPLNSEVLIEWIVTKNTDGTIVEKGSAFREFNIYSGIQKGDVIELNPNGEGWCSGDYTVTVYFNLDRSIEEAYYLNSIEKSFVFTITGNDCPVPEKEQENTSDVMTEPVQRNDRSVPTGVETNIAQWLFLMMASSLLYRQNKKRHF